LTPAAQGTLIKDGFSRKQPDLESRPLVEIVFSWGGAGQYAVQGVLNADLNPVLGFVLYSAILSLVVYLMVDLIYFAIDPRTR
jgi:ABC-type dipeptide/oligopeptide/nickel transport system permease component